MVNVLKKTGVILLILGLALCVYGFINFDLDDITPIVGFFISAFGAGFIVLGNVISEHKNKILNSGLNSPLKVLMVIPLIAGIGFWMVLEVPNNEPDNDYLASKGQEIISEYHAAKDILLSEYGFSCESAFSLSSVNRFYSEGKCLEGLAFVELEALQLTTFTRLQALLSTES